MKRKNIVALLLILTMICSLFAFTGCSDKESGEKQVPVYQGMTITNASTSTMSLMGSSYRSGEIMLLSANKENNGDNGNHNGHYKGDHTDRNDTIDEENPYPDNDENENIEEEIKSSLNVVGSPDTIYYTEPNQDIYINIHIDNPDSFEIMSFTLNGKKYSSYMFEEGSDMETIVLKYNVGDATGIIEYTIDAIKYIDGTEIKDVIIDGNKTVMAGVKTQNQVSANISNLNIGTNSLAFDANIKDNNALIEFSKGALKAVLYDGFSIVAEKDLVVGDNTVNFDRLKTNTLYQYAVVGYYDNLSGDGFGMNVLYKDAFYTDSMVLFDNITVGQENISFSFLWHEDHQSKAISALKLYKGDNFVKNVDVSATSISALLSNTTYKFVAEYSNGNNTESIYIEFTTFAKTAPSFVVKNESITTNSMNAQCDITDVDNILSSYKVELYKDNTFVSDNSDKAIDFTGLDYYTDYAVKISYTYDLNDGNGNQTATYSYAFKTLPYIDVTECNIANTSAVSEGETIFMSVKMDNPLGMTIESVVINGETYNVTGASTKNKIFVEIVYNGQFTGGDTYLKVDAVNAKIDSTALRIDPKTELSDNVFINGKLEVLKIEFVNDRFEPIDWAFPSEKVYELITLNNPTNYIVDYIDGEVDWIKINNNQYYKEFKGDFNQQICTLSTLTYHNQYIENTLSSINLSDTFHRLKSDEIIYISTPDDLKNMDDNYYYELTNDIDLSGMEWQGEGNDCIGVFNGNGYTISNMSFVGATKQARFGLFDQIGGIIYNLNISDVTFLLELVPSTGAGPSTAEIGLLGITNYGILEQISVKNSTIHVTGAEWIIKIGGLVTNNDDDIVNCDVTDCSISIGKSTEYFMGGITHRNYGSIDGCYFDGEIDCKSTYYSGTMQYGCPAIGGIVASNDGNITNCYATGTITASNAQSIGGIIGNNIGNVRYNISNMSFTNCNSSYLGGICADTWNEGKVSYNFTTADTRAIGNTYNHSDAENNFSVNDMSESEFYELCLKNNKYWELEDSKILFVK